MTKFKIGDQFDELPPTSRSDKYLKMKELMDSSPEVWILLSDNGSRSFNLLSASKNWDGSYRFSERTIAGIKYVFGKKES